VALTKVEGAIVLSTNNLNFCPEVADFDLWQVPGRRLICAIARQPCRPRVTFSSANHLEDWIAQVFEWDLRRLWTAAIARRQIRGLLPAALERKLRR